MNNLHTIIPLATEWVMSQEKVILANGEPLSQQGILDAKQMGVISPERVRLLRVSSIPMPQDPLLCQVAQSTNLISPNTIGMTLRYGIFIREDYWNDRELIAHECVHTSQYERFGSIEGFLQQYIKECVEIGYPNSPLEQEAITKAQTIKAANKSQ